MNALPTLSEEEISDWTDSRSLVRGEDYFQVGAISNPRLQGTRLLADCEGSGPTPYRVEMSLGEEGIVSGYCSCPVGGAGDCKHCVALLLTWLHEPEEFLTQEIVQNHLAERSREELVALIEQMVARHPDLTALLEMPISGVSTTSATLDPAVIRRQVDSAVDNMGYDGGWRRRGYGNDAQLYSIASQGSDYLAAGEVTNAVAVFTTLAEGVIESYDEMYDDEGEIVSVVDGCAEDLGECLKGTTDPNLRKQIFQTLFAIYQWDLGEGGIGGGDAAHAVLQTETTADEKAAIADLVRAELPAQSANSENNWRAKALGGFLLQLEAETLGDEDYLRLCRETGRIEDLVRRLLELERSSEAAEAAKGAPIHEFLALSRIIYAAGHTRLAEQIVAEQMEQIGRTEKWKTQEFHQQVISWMLVRDAASEALPLALLLLDESKRLAPYQQVREIAGKIGVWPEIQRSVLGKLEAQKEFSLLTQIYVEEKRVDDALAALALAEKPQSRFPYHANSASLRLSVAQLAEESRPQAAIEIYCAVAEQEINGRQRQTYASAAGYLKHAKTIYTRLEDIATWTALIAHIRQEYKRLRALQDELNKAGL